jgi:hypothetical protein
MVVKPRFRIGRKVKVALDGEVTWLRAPLEFRVSPTPLFLLKPGAGESAAADLEKSDT